MKICLLAPIPPPAGGIAAWTKRMMSEHLENGWEVVVVNEQVIGGRTNFGKKAKKKFVVEIVRCFKIWRDLVKTLRDQDVKIVQSCVPAGTGSLAREIVCQHIALFFKRKYVIHFRCTIPNMVKSKKNRVLLKQIIRKADEVFVLNAKSLDFLKSIYPSGNYVIIPNFVTQNEMISRNDVNERIKKILYVGGVIPEKGCDYIIETARHLPDINFVLIGKIGIKDDNLPPNVYLKGELEQKEIKNELLHSDVFIFLSRFWGEGFSNSLVEAMAASLPCIVSDWAANKDMIENKGGIVLKDYEVEDVVDAINELQDPERRLKMGRWNNQKVLNTYTTKQVTKKYVEEYDKIVCFTH